MLCPVLSVTGSLHNHPLGRAPLSSSAENFLSFWQQQWNTFRGGWSPLSHSLQNFPVGIARLISRDECNLNICLKGVKETHSGLPYRQCSLVDLGVGDLQQGMWASVSLKRSCISSQAPWDLLEAALLYKHLVLVLCFNTGGKSLVYFIMYWKLKCKS